ncbi:hypothetical protein CDAR_105831 [Caerostris darwini]|uniref:Uncharacterized protein n=1 Tax=Caerostris darwini TaxID=1538125 RepID=A0AAV4TP44_9ARAC|nr:hypothetical protein CDAR_105831 [Caerostris darwini]
MPFVLNIAASPQTFPRALSHAKGQNCLPLGKWLVNPSDATHPSRNAPNMPGKDFCRRERGFFFWGIKQPSLAITCDSWREGYAFWESSARIRCGGGGGDSLWSQQISFR